MTRPTSATAAAKQKELITMAETAKKAPAKKAPAAKKTAPPAKKAAAKPAAAPSGPECSYGDGKLATARGVGNAPVCDQHAAEARDAGYNVNEL